MGVQDGIRVRVPSRLWPLAALPLCLLAACDGDSSRPAHVPTQAAPPPAVPAPPPRPPPVDKPAPAARFSRAGLRGVAYSVDHWFEGRKRITQSVFENWSVAATYNLARRRLAHDRFFRAQRPLWEEWLRISRAERSGIAFAYGNHWLVDALGVFETL